MSFEEKSDAFWTWLRKNGVELSESIELKDYRKESAGRGVVATKDIKEDELLFSLPRSILLSQRTSKLYEKVAELDEISGWGPLILCMMYEMQLPDSFWKPYFDVLPRAFSTPMFWNEHQLIALKGSDILAKIGKEEAETLYREEILPVIKKYPEVLDENQLTLELFHMCGSIVMAYSFHDETQKAPKKNNAEEEEESDDEEEGLISMVPMADMLNHKTGFNNARLFHEPDCLQMKAIKAIVKGEQIYNTYGNLCNADLLRRYGFTDSPNEHDIVELEGPLAVEVCCEGQEKELITRKIDFLMEEGVLDECFVIDKEYEIPEELIVSVHVLSTSAEEFKRIEEKQKLPKPRLTQEVKAKIENMLKKRLEKYPILPAECKEMDWYSQNAQVVCQGEQAILKATLETLDRLPTVAEKRKGAEIDTLEKRHKK